MIHVLIERQIAPQMISTYEDLARSVFHRTYLAPGFISGEAFTDSLDSNHRFVLCKWRCKQDWDNWCDSIKRRELINKMGPTLEQPEKVTLMEN